MLVRKDFLIECRKRGIFPAHIVNSLKCIHPLLEENSPYTQKLQNTVERFKKGLLNIEIQHTHYKIKEFKRILEITQQQIETTATTEITSRFITTQNQSFENKKHILKRKTNSKLTNLLRKSDPTTDKIPTINDKSILNATNLHIPPEMQLLLSMGPKFSLPIVNPSQIPIYHLIADLESILQTSPDKFVQDKNRCQVVSHIQNHISRAKSHQRKTPLTSFCQKASATTKTFLQEHPDVCVLESDKGKKMVVMYLNDYEQKMSTLLDCTTYKVLPKDPTSSIQRQNNQIATRLQNLKLIDQVTFRRLQTSTSTCPSIYGQPKAHKPALPLRPVVPNVTAPTYNMSKFIATALKQSFHSKYNIVDSFKFAEYINTIKLPKDYVLVSFDVVSLFTNIPKDLVIHDIIMNWPDIKTTTNINLDLFIEIVEFCLNNSYFQFRDKFYLQTFGTAMGSPLSPILADLVMENLLNTVIRRLPFEIPVLRKYVDDLLLALPKNQVQYTLDTFNDYNEHIQFTIEEELNNTLPFLDTLIIRSNDQTISTQWYAKPIASGRLLNFHSLHPTSIKVNVATNFIKRVVMLSTNKPINQLKHIIFQHLRQNDYPSSLINRFINRNISKFSIQHHDSMSQHSSPPNSLRHNSAQNFNNQPSTPVPVEEPTSENTTSPCTTSIPSSITYRSIPFIPVLSKIITSILRPDFPTLKFAYRPIKTTKCLLKQIKDPVPPQLQSNVIYSIPCYECPMTYIGMTRNQLKTRLSGHRSNINKYTNLIDHPPQYQKEEIAQLSEKTALMQHIISHGHSFDLANTKIIDRTLRTSALPLLEMCHIANTPNTVNHRTDVQGLNTTYAGILHATKSISCSSRNRRKSFSTNTDIVPSKAP
ncbi:uncharacterized protein LOC131687767 [Topomyia yanbarensis]|uniref:uncharacterized protein LOC131687767 n=1 Tax=Topomyia yanbarensis TaxID=2498891 RepID=UPI00273C4FFF|nr:uncharacterized protein LOC131687767 [Topomyia yanbarensis]